MASKKSNTREQVGTRLDQASRDILEALQTIYAERAGLVKPMSQSDAMEIGLRELAKLHKINGRK